MRVLDVYFIGATKGYSCSTLAVRQSWDGSVYGETNCLEFAGANKHVKKNQTCDGLPVQGGWSSKEKKLLFSNP